MSEGENGSDTIECGRVPKNTYEDVVVSLTQYRGRSLIDIRIFTSYGVPDGRKLRPTKKGISLGVTALPILEAVIENAMNLSGQSSKPTA